MCIPSKDIILRRVDAKNYLFEKCPWYACHSELETCNMCFCIFYPCEDAKLGEYVISSKGGKVWSCMNCNWAHRVETMDALREFMKNEANRKMGPGELYKAFIKSMKSGSQE
ncbi:MAG: cysteine-rich small domain-containing protein [bacterium]|nr:cysteine-rich small domain-containing protein [bacterium]